MPRAVLDVAELIDERKNGAFQWRVFALCAAIVFVEGMNTQAAGYIATALREGLGMSPSELGYFFASGLLGLMFGALAIAPLADRFGRRPVLIGCVAFFAAASFGAAASTSILALDLFRFLTGLGIGGGMANAIALTAEYSPKRHRNFMVAAMMMGFIAGSIAIGLVAAEVVRQWGWQAIFIIDGILPLFLVPVLIYALPESVRFMVARAAPRALIARLIRRIDSDAEVDWNTRLIVEERPASGVSVAALFRDGHARSTVLLWIIYFMNLLDLYLFASWLTVHMTSAGIALETAIVIHSLFQVGGFVGFLFGWMSDRVGASRALFTVYLIGAIASAGIGFAGASVPLLTISVLLAGAGIAGGQACANGFAASLYPTQIRSTGIGWATGIGRAGSILGPLLAGILIEAGVATENIFYLAVIPAGIACLAGAGLGGLRRAVPVKQGAVA